MNKRKERIVRGAETVNLPLARAEGHTHAGNREAAFDQPAHGGDSLRLSSVGR
jgi:hypothetical protein